MIEVVAGVIVRGGRILLAQRPEYKSFPSAWECPGGKREAGETYQETIVRELREEFGIEVISVAQAPIWAGAINEGSDVLIHFFNVLEYDGRPVPLEGQGFGWFTPEEMRSLVMTPGNQAAMPALPHVVKIVFPEVM